jgi:hypothetical protein
MKSEPFDLITVGGSLGLALAIAMARKAPACRDRKEEKFRDRVRGSIPPGVAKQEVGHRRLTLQVLRKEVP